MLEWPVTGARWFHRYVRWSLYLLIIAMPVQLIPLLMESPPLAWEWVVTLGALAGLHTTLTLLALRWCLDRALRGPRTVPLAFVAAWVGTLLALCAAILSQRVFGESIVIAYILGGTIAAATPLMTLRWATTLSVLAVAIAIPLMLLRAGWLLVFLFFVWVAWPAAWMLRAFHELHRAHELRAQLSIAEERLRIARDLHDVFGRTLATISVKSELAAELSKRGQHERAADEMAHIREIANAAGTEVRRVVRGERRTNWADEVEGARALLTSAGIRCVVAGEDVPETYAESLAWVIREGVTNVLRHSRATQVSITTAVEADEVALTLTNDGATEPSPSEPNGMGLAAMADRIRDIGGMVEHEHDGDWFWLSVSIPVSQEAPA